jgi:hypothetical protein
MSNRPALQGRHLAERAQPRGGAHHERPESEPEPQAARVLIRRELRGEPVERVGKTGAERHENACAASGPAKRERGERDRRQHAEHNPETRPFSVSRVASRGGQREQRHAGRDREHRQTLATAYPLAQPPPRDREQEDETCAQQRLHERERRPRQRVGLREPAREAERGTEQPARPPHETPQQREAQRSLPRLHASLQRLQPHRDRIERGRAERGEHADQEVGHRLGGR